jgi:hypothetical protein
MMLCASAGQYRRGEEDRREERETGARREERETGAMCQCRTVLVGEK